MWQRVLAASLLISACGDNVPSIALEDHYAERLAARCEYMVRCGLFANADTCAGYFRVPNEAELHAAIAAGKLRYDGAKAHVCQIALAAATCDRSAREARVVPACDGVFAGAIDDGDACGFHEECRSGRCDLPTCQFDMCCPGTCLPTQTRAALDEPCETDAGCVADAFCGADARCHALAKLGERCTRDSECDYHLGCIGASELQLGFCRAMPLLGERCPYQRCAEDGAYCNAAKLCTPVGLPGSPCTSDAECSIYASCAVDLGMCVDTPTLGMPCIDECAGEAYCNLDTALCASPLENTTPCTSDNQCLSLFCDEGVAFDSCTDRPVCI